VTNAHLADFCSQCGPANNIERVTSKEGKKTVFVELAVKRAVAESFVKSFATGCRIKPQQLRYSNVNLLYHIREN
jgi:hypothetical protein